jgi:hypothetical protein
MKQPNFVREGRERAESCSQAWDGGKRREGKNEKLQKLTGIERLSTRIAFLHGQPSHNGDIYWLICSKIDIET